MTLFGIPKQVVFTPRNHVMCSLESPCFWDAAAVLFQMLQDLYQDLIDGRRRSGSGCRGGEKPMTRGLLVRMERDSIILYPRIMKSYEQPLLFRL